MDVGDPDVMFGGVRLRIKEAFEGERQEVQSFLPAFHVDIEAVCKGSEEQRSCLVEMFADFILEGTFLVLAVGFIEDLVQHTVCMSISFEKSRDGLEIHLACFLVLPLQIGLLLNQEVQQSVFDEVQLSRVKIVSVHVLQKQINDGDIL